MNKKIQNIQALRGVAALSVLFFHIMLMERKWGNGSNVLSDLLNIGATGVDLFFVISGFVMITATRELFQQKNIVFLFLFKRISKIYPLYWFYSFILLAVFLIRPELVNPTQGSQVNLLESFLLLPQIKLPLLMVGWPLVHEIYFYIVFSIFLLFPEKHLIKLLLLWSISCISGYSILHRPDFFCTNPYWIIIFSPLTMEFIFGCFAAILITDKMNKHGSKTLGLGVFVMILSGLYYYLFPMTQIFDPRLRVILFGIPYSLIVHGVAAMEIDKGRSFLSVLKKIGNQSYSLYLSHTLVINGIGWFWLYTTTDTVDNHMIWLSAMLFFSILTGYCSYLFLEKPLMNLSKKLSGKIFHPVS
jgi:exopolysaccharide production protein ExoZ